MPLPHIPTSLRQYLQRWLMIAAFMAALMLPLVGHISGMCNSDYIKKTEKRNPHPLPIFPKKANRIEPYLADLENYINDHFGFRHSLVKLNSYLRFSIGASATQTVIIGKKGWLYYTGGNIIPQYRGIDRFSDLDLDAWIEAMKARTTWFEAQNIPYIIALCPDKSTIYPEYLPDWINQVDPTRIDQLSSRLRIQNQGLTFIDLRDALLSAKRRYPVYYKTDSHWNFHGGFVGYQEIMKRLSVLFPDIHILSDADVSLFYKTGFNQDLAATLDLSVTDSNADYYQLKKPSKVISKKPLGETRLPFRVESSTDSKLKVLIIRDSFTDLMEPYFNETFSEIIYAGHHDMMLDTQLVQSFQPDIVIHILVERLLKITVHPPFGPQDLYVVNWGPKTVKPGETFYKQSDGWSAMWIKAYNLTLESAIVWEGKELSSVVALKNDTISALVPTAYYQDPGTYEIYIQDRKTGKQSQKIYIQVTP